MPPHRSQLPHLRLMQRTADVPGYASAQRCSCLSVWMWSWLVACCKRWFLPGAGDSTSFRCRGIATGWSSGGALSFSDSSAQCIQQHDCCASLLDFFSVKNPLAALLAVLVLFLWSLDAGENAERVCTSETRARPGPSRLAVLVACVAGIPGFGLSSFVRFVYSCLNVWRNHGCLMFGRCRLTLKASEIEKERPCPMA